MKTNPWIVLAVFVTGVTSGLLGSNLVKPAYAAPNAIVVQSAEEIIAKCDFNKTIVVARQVICVQK